MADLKLQDIIVSLVGGNNSKDYGIISEITSDGYKFININDEYEMKESSIKKIEENRFVDQNERIWQKDINNAIITIAPRGTKEKLLQKYNESKGIVDDSLAGNNNPTINKVNNSGIEDVKFFFNKNMQEKKIESSTSNKKILSYDDLAETFNDTIIEDTPIGKWQRTIGFGFIKTKDDVKKDIRDTLASAILKIKECDTTFVGDYTEGKITKTVFEESINKCLKYANQYLFGSNINEKIIDGIFNFANKEREGLRSELDTKIEEIGKEKENGMKEVQQLQEELNIDEKKTEENKEKIKEETQQLYDLTSKLSSPGLSQEDKTKVENAIAETNKLVEKIKEENENAAAIIIQKKFRQNFIKQKQDTLDKQQKELEIERQQKEEELRNRKYKASVSLYLFSKDNMLYANTADDIKIEVVNEGAELTDLQPINRNNIDEKILEGLKLFFDNDPDNMNGFLNIMKNINLEYYNNEIDLDKKGKQIEIEDNILIVNYELYLYNQNLYFKIDEIDRDFKKFFGEPISRNYNKNLNYSYDMNDENKNFIKNATSSYNSTTGGKRNITKRRKYRLTKRKNKKNKTFKRGGKYTKRKNRNYKRK